MATIAKNEVQQLLTSLYAGGVENDADWSKLQTAGVDNLQEKTKSGDSALQALMTQLAVDKVGDSEQAERVFPILAGIKAYMVHEILEELPTTSVEDLRIAAEKAGYDLEIIG